jgi:hypothetical protein
VNCFKMYRGNPPPRPTDSRDWVLSNHDHWVERETGPGYTSIHVANDAVSANAGSAAGSADAGSGAVDEVTRRRFDALPSRDEDGNRISTCERLRHARETTPEAGGGDPGSAPAPIEISSLPEVKVVRWTRCVSQSASHTATRVHRSVWRFGARVRFIPPVSADTLYLTAACPPDRMVIEPHHMCSICQGVKEHPVS